MADFRWLLAMLNLVGQRAQDQRFYLGDSFFLSSTVGHRSAHRWNFGDPSPVIFLLGFYAHGDTLYVMDAIGKRVILALWIVICTCNAAEDVALPEFAGLLKSASSGPAFSLRWKSGLGTKSQSWKQVGDTVAGFEIVGFDDKSDSLSLRDSTGKLHQLSLPESRTTEELSEFEIKALMRDLVDRNVDTPILTRAKARAFWLWLLARNSKPLPPNLIVDFEDPILSPKERANYLEGRKKYRDKGMEFILTRTNAGFHGVGVPRNFFNFPERMTVNLTEADWDELSLLTGIMQVAMR